MGLREALDIEILERSDGRARLSMKVSDHHLNDGGILHGGAIATLADCAMGSALSSNLGEGQPVTVESKVNYLEPGREGVVTATGRIRRQGKRFTLLEAEMVQEETGEHIAYATATFTTIDGDAAS